MFIVQLKFARVEKGRLVLHDCEYAKPQRACQRGKEKKTTKKVVQIKSNQNSFINSSKYC